MRTSIAFKRLSEEAVIPGFATAGSAGLDLTVIEGGLIEPGKIGKFHTGLAMRLPEGTVGLIQARSSSYMKGLAIEGVVDEDYLGPIMIMIRNLNEGPFMIEAGARYAQMLVLDLHRRPHRRGGVEGLDQPDILEVRDLGETQRGSGGFGSTGK